MGNRWVAVLDRWLHQVAVLETVLARLHLGCTLGRWLLCSGGCSAQVAGGCLPAELSVPMH